MRKINDALRIMQTLVESAGGSIDPVRQLLCKNHTDVTAEGDRMRLDELCYKAFNGFFHCAAQDVTFTDVRRIRQFFGRTLEEVYPRVSPTFMKLARTYWTFKLVLIECRPDRSVCTSLLQDIEINFAGLFFPTPGISPPKELREKTIRTVIEQSGADFDIEDYIRNNPYLR